MNIFARVALLLQQNPISPAKHRRQLEVQR